VSDRQPTGRSHTSGDLRADGGQTRTPFTDSPVVTTTVRLLSPFVLTLGLFTLFHGTSSVGGGFQGGVVAAATVITVAFALGLSPTADWIDARVLGALVASGVLVFGLVALAGVAFGGAFLQLDVLPIPKATVYATEAIEVGIGATVAAVIVVLFVRIGEGYVQSTRAPSPDDATDAPASLVPESVASVDVTADAATADATADAEEGRDE
jgi:multicomponent Na+:H+ antiporter subunit B